VRFLLRIRGRHLYFIGDDFLDYVPGELAELGTILAIADDRERYLVVFENGTKMVLPPKA
jgi:hypothetical protein